METVAIHKVARVEEEAQDKIANVLRELVKVVYEECDGAYGGDYEGDFEREIQAVARTIVAVTLRR